MRLTDAALGAGLADLPEWEQAGDAIRRTFKLRDFVEAANHHPDIDIRWNRVLLTLSTHSEGGLTDKDLALAHEIDRVSGVDG